MEAERGPLRLANLSIRNFRGIASLDLDFTDTNGTPLDQVLLVGSNATGKTSVLEAVRMLLGGGRDDYPRLPEVQRLVRFGARDFGIRGHFVTQRAIIRSLSPFDLSLTVERWMEYLGYVPDSGSHTGFLVPGAAHGISIAGLKPQVQCFEATSERETLNVAHLEEQLVATATSRAIRRGPAPTPEADPFARIQKAWQAFEAQQTHLDLIQESNNPGSRVRIVIRDGRAIPDDVTSLTMARELAPSRPDIPRLITFDQLSAGQRLLFSYVGPLVFQDAPVELVLIDEAERHLHPRWTLQLVKALRAVAPEAQFIVTSHSPYIVDTFAPEAVLLLASVDGEIRSRRLIEHPDYKRLGSVLDPGEFWSSVGESWIARPPAPVAE